MLWHFSDLPANDVVQGKTFVLVHRRHPLGIVTAHNDSRPSGHHSTAAGTPGHLLFRPVIVVKVERHLRLLVVLELDDGVGEYVNGDDGIVAVPVEVSVEADVDGVKIDQNVQFGSEESPQSSPRRHQGQRSQLLQKPEVVWVGSVDEIGGCHKLMKKEEDFLQFEGVTDCRPQRLD